MMHHPLNWLTEWAEKELKTILHKDFALCLSGHAHDQSAFNSVSKDNSLCECAAPPLFTKKTADLGYSIISISPDKGVTEIAYRQWTKHHSFVAGVNFSNTDDGKVIIVDAEERRQLMKAGQKGNVDFVDRYLTQRLTEALVSFSSQPIVWADPVLCKSPEIERDDKSEDKVALSDFIANPKSTVIKAPPQFGSTCLALYLAREAWRAKESSLWLYLDSKNLKHYTSVVEKAVETELNLLGCDKRDIKCIILDSWMSQEKDSRNLLEKVCILFKDVPVIVMQTIDDTRILNTSDVEIQNREFDVLYLWALPRGHIRKVVIEYNDKKHIGDDDSIITKVVSDLEVLNLHRTPLNCLTLLKVAEVDFDESPVNRTEMIKRVLFLLFNVDNIPTYKVQPDLKDCEHVLGYYCETMIRENRFVFSMEYFLHVLREYCKERLIDLEIQVVFDVLHQNNIIVKHGDVFCFRFAYWVYYFIAQRMHHDQNFANFILEDKRYTRAPEIIEFYTGIDRRREDALQVLIKDIQDSCDEVRKKCGIPDGLNPYRFAEWRPSAEMLAQMQSEISNGVRDSNLPPSVKDRYADLPYDRTRPYNQEIREILSGYSFVYLVQTMKAGATALRNSDYANPSAKRELLKEILRCWEQISNVLLILLPLLAEKEYAVFDGVGFMLFGNFGDTPMDRLGRILTEIPTNIVNWCQNDLFSQKMGPLLIDQLDSEVNELKRHELMLLLIEQRPREWKTQVQKYIKSVRKNSFYLFDVYRTLQSQYRYSYASSRTLKDIEYLIRMAAAKHLTGNKNPGIKLIKKMPDKVIPKREVD